MNALLICGGEDEEAYKVINRFVINILLLIFCLENAPKLAILLKERSIMHSSSQQMIGENYMSFS